VKRHLSGLLKRSLRSATSAGAHPIEQIVLRSAGLTRQPTDGQIDQMAASAIATLNPLLSTAMSGNVHAIRKVAELASHLCAETTTLACMHQQAADTVARERTTWPLALSHDPKARRRTLRLLTGPRRLPLGNPPRPAAVTTKKTAGFSSPTNSALLVALKAIEIERSFRIPSELFPSLQPGWSAAAGRLMDLDLSTADVWFEVIWMYICDRHGGTPEKSELRRLAGVKEPSTAPVTDPSLRASLRRTLEEAFFQLVRGRERGRKRKQLKVR
jgi:hypothetical protein